MLIIFISLMLLYHVHIKAKCSGFSLDEVFKLTLKYLTRYIFGENKIALVDASL